MKKLRYILVAAACCALLALVVGATSTLLTTPTLAGMKYSTQVIRGTYAWRCTGNVAPQEGAPLVPAVGQGTVTSDADGFFKGGGTLSLGGQIFGQRVEGPAQVNPDGTGSIVYQVHLVLPDGTEIPAPDWHINFLILDEGKAVWGMPYDQGSSMLCTLQRME